MKNIALLSGLLIIGLMVSQLLPSLVSVEHYVEFEHIIRLLTTAALGFIMIHVGYQFDIDKSRLKAYGWDYVVAAISAALPWLFIACYFYFILSEAGTSTELKESLLASRFAAPTSAGILFCMLAASGLAATWVYKKIRVLAIFDDVDTVLFMVLLQMMFVGWRWQLGIVAAIMFIFLWAAWRYLHQLRIPITWPWVISYSVVITLISDAVYHVSKMINEHEPVHVEILLPAFVLGCVIVRNNIPAENKSEPQKDILKNFIEKRVSFMVSAIFMLLVGLSMPAVVTIANSAISDAGSISIGWGWIAIHVIIVTFIANLGKLFPLFCYRKEAHWKERLALSVGMFPRGEVGAGVLIISMAYGVGGAMITVAMLSLTLNLLLTGVYITIVKKLLVSVRKLKVDA